MQSAIRDITETEFVELFQNTGKLIVLEFYLKNCPHCKEMAPVYEEIAAELGDSALFTKINAQENQRLAKETGVSVTPTFKFFCNQEELGEVPGATNKTILRNTIKDFIKHASQCGGDTPATKYDVDGYG